MFYIFGAFGFMNSTFLETARLTHGPVDTAQSSDLPGRALGLISSHLRWNRVSPAKFHTLEPITNDK